MKTGAESTCANLGLLCRSSKHFRESQNAITDREDETSELQHLPQAMLSKKKIGMIARERFFTRRSNSLLVLLSRARRIAQVVRHREEEE